MKKLAALVAFAVAGTVAAAVWQSYAGRAQGPWLPPAVMKSETVDGRTLYMRDCAWCHGADGRGTVNGPDLGSVANGPAHVDFVLSTGRMPILDPEEAMYRSDSPYTPEQIAALVGYTEDLGITGPAIPELDLAGANLGLGNQLYQQNCAACHASTGIGGTLGSGGRTLSSGMPGSEILAPGLADSTPVEVAEAMLAGPGTMPVFGPETFTDEEVNSIVAYVQHLRNPDNPGGLAMGRIGPWSEGAVAWTAGLGSLVLLLLWIGTRVGRP